MGRLSSYIRDYLNETEKHKDTPLRKYRSTRSYSKAELDSESDEFFSNKETSSAAPGAFKHKRDFVSKVKAAKSRYLATKHLHKMQNTDVSSVLHAGTQGQQAAREKATEYKKDWKSLETGFKKGHKIPPPLVLKDKKGSMRLLAGNTRLMVGAGLGHHVPVKVIRYQGSFKKPKP